MSLAIRVLAGGPSHKNECRVIIQCNIMTAEHAAHKGPCYLCGRSPVWMYECSLSFVIVEKFLLQH